MSPQPPKITNEQAIAALDVETLSEPQVVELARVVNAQRRQRAAARNVALQETVAGFIVSQGTIDPSTPETRAARRG